MAENFSKHSYTISCSSEFRDAVKKLAAKFKVNVADMARSAVLMMPPDVIASFPDPGEPQSDDRETVTLKSGVAKGRPWRRKPRLQVRMAPGCDIKTIRKALGLALAMDRGEMEMRMDSAQAAQQAAQQAADKNEDKAKKDIAAAEANLIRQSREELERLRSIVSALSFDPLPGGVMNREDALHVFGFPPSSNPDSSTLRSRFRTLATVHHPDGDLGSHKRMSQLNAAMDHLRRGAA